jgi:hypothetical protein
MFPPPLKRTFDVFNIQLILLENQKLLLDKSFYCSLILAIAQIYPNSNPNQKYFGQQNLSIISPKDVNAHDI